MKSLAIASFLAATLLYPTNRAAAEDRDDVTSYRFEDTLVGGDGVGPDGEVLRVPPRPARQSLVRVREHFVPELLDSAEHL